MKNNKFILKSVSKILLPVYILSNLPISATAMMNDEPESEPAAAAVTDTDSSSNTDDAEFAHSYLMQVSFEDFIITPAQELGNWENVISALVDPKNPTESIINADGRAVGVDLYLLRFYLQCCIRAFPNHGDEVLEHMKNYFLQKDNLCDPQKRFMLLYMLACLEKEYMSAPEPVREVEALYRAIIEINETMSKKAIELALDDKNTDEAKRNVLKRIFALIQLSESRYEYSRQKPWYTGSGCEGEYVTSVLSHGETVVIELPYSTNFEELMELLGIPKDRSEIGLVPRVSTHGVKVDDTGDRLVESKGFMNSAETAATSAATKLVQTSDYVGACMGFNMDPEQRLYWSYNVAELLSKVQFQYGFDIPINSYMPEVSASRGHVLISFIELNGRSALLVKLEDSGPQGTSVTGHTHGPSGKGNHISATSHIRLFNQYENRLALTCTLAKFDKEKLGKKVSEVVQTASSADLTGPQVLLRAHIDPDELIAPLHIPGVDIYRNGRSCFCGNTNYGYIITNRAQFRAWCSRNGLTDAEIMQIESNSNRWLYTTRSYSGDDLQNVLPAKFFGAISYIKSWFTAAKHTNPQGDIIVHDVPPTGLFKYFIFEEFNDQVIADSHVDISMVEDLERIIEEHKKSSLWDKLIGS